MNPRHAAETYRRSSIEHAPPIKIVRMLYQGALRYLDQAAEEDPSRPGSRFNHWLGRADAIVTELRLAIDHGVPGDLTENLERLYVFCEEEIGRASLERSCERIAGVKQVLGTLLDAWQRVEIDHAEAA